MSNWLIGGIVLSVVGILLLIVIWKLMNLPITAAFNNPKAFLKKSKNMELGNKKVMVCIGDSITHGLVSGNYVDVLEERFHQQENLQNIELVNAGINSELVWMVRQRLEEIIQCNPAIITILIGTNDANRSFTPEQQKKCQKEHNLPQLPSYEFFTENYTLLIEELQSRTRAKIAVLSIPPIGELPDLPIVHHSDRFSRFIQTIAEEKNLTYLPLRETMNEIIAQRPPHVEVPYEDWQRYIIKGIVRHLIFNQPLEKYGEKWGFDLHCDHLHLNLKGATIVADLIEQFVNDDVEGGK